MDKDREESRDRLIKAVQRLGYPVELGELIANELGTPKTMNRMISYLHQGKPTSAEEIVDEMLAIEADRDAWVRKKKAEYYNRKHNEAMALQYSGFHAKRMDVLAKADPVSSQGKFPWLLF